MENRIKKIWLTVASFKALLVLLCYIFQQLGTLLIYIVAVDLFSSSQLELVLECNTFGVHSIRGYFLLY